MKTFRGKPEEYEKWYYTRYGSRIAKKELDAVVALAGGRKLLLDIGCGTGFFAEKLSSLGYKVFGVDVDEEMLRYASLKPSLSGKLVRADSASLPFSKDSFDIALFITSLEFMDDPKAALCESAHCAKEIIIVALNKTSLKNLILWVKSLFFGKKFYELSANTLSPKMLRKIAGQCGLTVEYCAYLTKPLGLGPLSPVLVARLVRK